MLILAMTIHAVWGEREVTLIIYEQLRYFVKQLNFEDTYFKIGST